MRLHTGRSYFFARPLGVSSAAVTIIRPDFGSVWTFVYLTTAFCPVRLITRAFAQQLLPCRPPPQLIASTTSPSLQDSSGGGGGGGDDGDGRGGGVVLRGGGVVLRGGGVVLRGGGVVLRRARLALRLECVPNA